MSQEEWQRRSPGIMLNCCLGMEGNGERVADRHVGKKESTFRLDVCMCEKKIPLLPTQ